MYLLTDCIYKVVSHSELDGFHVDHFHDLAEAREFAANLSAEGYDCVTCRVLEAFDAKARDDYGVIPGADYPASLFPATELVRA